MARVNWRGRQVSDRVIRAARIGVDRTTTSMAVLAKRTHTWRNVTGLAEGSIQMRPARVEAGGRITGQFGSYGVQYFLWLELGSQHQQPRPVLRPSFDREARNLPGNIKAALARA